MFGPRLPKIVALLASSYSSVSVVVVTRRSSSVELPGAVSSIAKTREPVVGVPSE